MDLWQGTWAALERVGAGSGLLGLVLSGTIVRYSAEDYGGVDTLVGESGDLVDAFTPTLAPRLWTTAAAASLCNGELDEADRRLERTAALHRQLGPSTASDVTAVTAAARSFLRGEPGEAERTIHGALPALQQNGLLPEIWDSLGILAAVAADTGDAERAVRLWSCVEISRLAHGHVASPLSRVVSSRSAATGSALGERAADVVRSGESMSISEAIAYASRSRGPRQRPAIGWESLTPTEIEVVEHVARGLSNREVGERLFVSAGTVKTHLAHVYAKLGLANRTEVTRAFSERLR
jgi:DNA-binding CsgD family transcriptional regulator